MAGPARAGLQRTYWDVPGAEYLRLNGWARPCGFATHIFSSHTSDTALGLNGWARPCGFATTTGRSKTLLARGLNGWARPCGFATSVHNVQWLQLLMAKWLGRPVRD